MFSAVSCWLWQRSLPLVLSLCLVHVFMKTEVKHFAALAVLAALILFMRKPSIRIVLFFISLCVAAVGIALPGTFFPLCRMDTMHCRAVMKPAMIILFASELIVSVCGIIVERNRIRRERA